ncbi:MAG: phosphotransferase, partial [Chloroflexota bacterium]|nr:phosphotransferase [Chloroflexota bacterium]
RRFTPRLVGAASVHRHMWTVGFPCPQPLAGPTEFGGSWMSAETRVVGGTPLIDDPEAPELHAAALAEFIRLAPHGEVLPTLVPPPDFAHWNHTEAGRWPRRDRGDVDLNQESDPIWLSSIADRVRSRLATFQRPSVIGHADWWSENLHWVGHRLHVLHDWDSVTAQPEAILAGEAAYLFAATTFELDGEAPGATIEGTERFLVAFEQARGRPWSADEREAAWAAGLWVAAFHARLSRFEDRGEGFADLVRRDAPERLRRAGA